MIFKSRKRSEPDPTDDADDSADLEPGDESTGLNQGLAPSRRGLGQAFKGLFGARQIDQDLLEEIETALLTADVGVAATTDIITDLTARVEKQELTDADALWEALRQQLTDLLIDVEKPLSVQPEAAPYVVLVVGVNGAGKTTTIGKLARRWQQRGWKIMLAAGDTFRAAAVEQLVEWGERNQVPVVSQQPGADPASVIFDAMQSAQARDIDVLIADTAGRLHTQDNLMNELRKIVRVIRKHDETAPHEIMLVLDGGTGQNAVAQARQFNQAVNVTGLTVTKLDGTARGGMVFALAKEFGLPIRYVGVGEKLEDLRIFRARDFANSLLPALEE